MKLFLVNDHTIIAAERCSQAVLAYRELGRRKLKRLADHGVTNPTLTDTIINAWDLSEKTITEITVGGIPIMKYAKEKVQRTKRYPCLIAWWEPDEVKK